MDFIYLILIKWLLKRRTYRGGSELTKIECLTTPPFSISLWQSWCIATWTLHNSSAEVPPLPPQRIPGFHVRLTFGQTGFAQTFRVSFFVFSNNWRLSFEYLDLIRVCGKFFNLESRTPPFEFLNKSIAAWLCLAAIKRAVLLVLILVYLYILWFDR